MKVSKGGSARYLWAVSGCKPALPVIVSSSSIHGVRYENTLARICLGCKHSSVDVHGRFLMGGRQIYHAKPAGPADMFGSAHCRHPCDNFNMCSIMAHPPVTMFAAAAQGKNWSH